MRLLVVAPHFTPDTAPTGVVVTALVDEWARLGHSSHVVTSLPWYEEHRVADGWRGRVARRGRHGGYLLSPDAGSVDHVHQIVTVPMTAGRLQHQVE